MSARKEVELFRGVHLFLQDGKITGVNIDPHLDFHEERTPTGGLRFTTGRPDAEYRIIRADKELGNGVVACPYCGYEATGKLPDLCPGCGLPLAWEVDTSILPEKRKPSPIPFRIVFLGWVLFFAIFMLLYSLGVFQ